MHIGVEIFPTDQTIGAIELAREVEAHGYESLWFPEHSHIPTSRATPRGGREGAPPLPEFYWRTFDPFVALGACAAVTEQGGDGPARHPLHRTTSDPAREHLGDEGTVDE